MTADDSSWRDLTEGHERLRWSRSRWETANGISDGSATGAAESLGMEPGTYRAYERPPGSSKHTPMDHQTAIRFASKFKVNWVWLLTGKGTPFDDQPTAHADRVMRAMVGLPEGAQRAIADLAESLGVPRTGTKD